MEKGREPLKQIICFQSKDQLNPEPFFDVCGSS